MTPEAEDIPDDPVLRLIFNGQAATLHDAEELFLDASRYHGEIGPRIEHG